MVTGNVDSQTLIKKLTKTGKHAELWPQKADSKKKKQGKSENKEKQSDQEAGEDSNQTCDNENETVRVVVQDEAGNEGCATGKSGVQFQEPKPEQKQTVTVLAGNQPPVAEKKVSIAVQGGNENGTGNEKSGSGSKKKKKKGQKGNNNGNEGGGEQSGGAPANQAQVLQAHGPVPIPSPANQSPPRHHIYHQYPPQYYAAPVSYHTAYPSSSYGAAYYTSPGSYSYAHVHPGFETEMEPPLEDLDSYTSLPTDTFELLSDENPNGCAIM